MRKTAIVLIFLGVIAFASADLIPVPFQSCSSAGSAFNPEKAFISQAPKAGVTEQITIEGKANSAFTFADAQVTATVLGITVLSQKVTLSGSYNAGDAVTAVASLQIPSWAPSATATVYVRAHDASGNELACGQTQITITSSISLSEEILLLPNDLIPVPFQSCSAAGSAFTPKEAFISQTPKAGVTEQITINGVANAAFTFADAQVTAKVLGITVLSQKVTLSGTYKAGDAVSAVASLEIPSWAPAATATVYVRAHDAAGNELACGQAQITISSSVSLESFGNSLASGAILTMLPNDLIPVPFKSCSAAGSAFTPNQAFISQTPKAGVTEQITINGVANAAFTFADAQVTATVLGITVLSQKVTLSGSYKAGDAVSAVASLEIPSWAPAATATVYVKAHDAAGTELACGQAQITISSSLSVESFKNSFTSIAQLLKRKHKKHLGDNIPLPFTNCGSATDALNVESVYITAPIAKGITEGVIIQGAARSAFTLSSAVAKVKFIGITVATKSFSFSNSYNAGDAVSITLSIDIPSIAPSVSFLEEF